MERKIDKGIAYYIKTSAHTGVLNKEGNLAKLGENDPINTQKEQERTRVKKEMFTTVYVSTLGSIKATCTKVGISRETYRLWLKQDKEFATKIAESFIQKLEDTEQQLNQAILNGNIRAITYFLDRRHPLYMPKIKVEGPKEGEKSAEEYLKEFEWVNDKKIYEIKAENKQPLDVDSDVKDQGQTGKDNTVQPESSTELLQPTTQEEKPSTQS